VSLAQQGRNTIDIAKSANGVRRTSISTRTMTTISRAPVTSAQLELWEGMRWNAFLVRQEPCGMPQPNSRAASLALRIKFVQWEPNTLMIRKPMLTTLGR